MISVHRDSLVFLLEAALLGILVSVGVLLAELHLLSLTAASYATLLLLLSLILMSWKCFDHGRHPCFLFLGMLFIFQGGRLLLPLTDAERDPFRIELQTLIPFDVSHSTGYITLLMIALSAVCIYLPCRWRPRRVLLQPGWEQDWLPAAYLLLAITLPFAAYKNYLYFSYLRAHGGYIAVYTDNAGVLASAGFVVRLISLIGSTVFFAVFVMERRKRFLAWLTAVYLLISVLDLLIGFRGKFFLLLLTLWYISKLKSGKGFRVMPLVVLFFVLSVMAVVTASFRENTKATLVNPIGFVVLQGISMQVTEIAIDQYDQLARHAGAYLVCGFNSGFSSLRNLPEGSCLDLDISRELNPISFEAGYATGSSYLAELYLWGGILSISLGSLSIGLFLRWLHERSATFFGGLLVIFFLPNLIYLPRLNLLAPISFGLKLLLILGLVAPALMMLHVLVNRLRSVSRLKYGIGEAAFSENSPRIEAK